MNSDLPNTRAGAPLRAEPHVCEAEGTFLLQVEPAAFGMPGRPMDLPEGQFLPKEEFHVTVIGRDPGALLHRAGVAMDTVSRHVHRVSWTIQPREAFWLIEAPPKPGYTDKRRSIIQMVDVPGLENFLDALAESSDIRLPKPPTHMTWYTQNWSHGIGLDTEDEFRERRVRRLSNSEVARLRDHCTRSASR